MRKRIPPSERDRRIFRTQILSERKIKISIKGYRNSYEPMRSKTQEGNLTLQIPQIRANQEPFNSKLKQFFWN